MHRIPINSVQFRTDENELLCFDERHVHEQEEAGAGTAGPKGDALQVLKRVTVDVHDAVD